MTWENESREIAELAEMAEESAQVERAALGSCAGWFFGSAECPMAYETGYDLWDDDRMEPFDDEWTVSEEWLAWEAASEDIPMFFELNLSV